MPLPLILRARNLLDAARLGAVRSLSLCEEAYQSISLRLISPIKSESALAMVQAKEALIIAEARQEVVAVRAIANRLEMLAKNVSQTNISLVQELESIANSAARSAQNAEARLLALEKISQEGGTNLNLSLSGGVNFNQENEEGKTLSKKAVTMTEVVASTLSLDMTDVGIIDTYLRSIDVNPYNNPSAAETVAAVVNTAMTLIPVNAVDEITHSIYFPITSELVNALEATADWINPPVVVESPDEIVTRRLALDPGFRRDIDREIEIRNRESNHEATIKGKLIEKQEAERIKNLDANIKDQRAKQALKRQEKMWKELEEKAGISLEKNQSLIDPDAEYLGQSIDPNLENVKVSQTL